MCILLICLLRNYLTQRNFTLRINPWHPQLFICFIYVFIFACRRFGRVQELLRENGTVSLKKNVDRK